MAGDPYERGAGEARATTSEDRALQVARHWIEAFNQRDAEALLRLADPHIELHPSMAFSRHHSYDGHEGLREWLAEMSGVRSPESVRVIACRPQRSGEILVTGEVILQGRAVSPIGALFAVRDGTVTGMRSYLSDEATLKHLGHVDT